MNTQDEQNQQDAEHMDDLRRKKRLPLPDDDGGVTRLKAERVQEAARFLGRGWKVTPSQGGIGRTRSFTNRRAAAAYAGYLVQHAAATNQEVALRIAGKAVTIELEALPLRPGGPRLLAGETLHFAREIG